MRLVRVAAVISLILALAPYPATSASSAEAAGTATIDTTTEATEAGPRRKMVKWNEYDGPVTTLRVSIGFLFDVATFAQNDESKQQVDMEPGTAVRDFRFLFGGRFKTQRPFSWTVGYMYDAKDDEWRFRKSGFLIGVPELAGQFFIGRDKEGYSMVKVMNGYHPWGMERSPGMDAFIPILADGVRYMGYYAGPRVFVNLGWFTDTLSENEGFSTYDTQTVARLGWLPILSDENKEVLHVAAMVRDAEPDEGMLQVRSKPENNIAPYVVDTGKFPADHVLGTGIEAYYRKGPWLFGGEYDWQDVSPVAGGNVLFHGGNLATAWLITGETRGYNTAGGYFNAVSPNKTVFEGGPGAWEAVLTLSYIDLDSGVFQGGQFWRVTPMVNWHLSDNLRLEFVYGYGELDRFDTTGGTQFFQGRIQLFL